MLHTRRQIVVTKWLDFKIRYFNALVKVCEQQSRDGLNWNPVYRFFCSFCGEFKEKSPCGSRLLECYDGENCHFRKHVKRDQFIFDEHPELKKSW
jgi:hypothetical protein